MDQPKFMQNYGRAVKSGTAKVAQDEVSGKMADKRRSIIIALRSFVYDWQGKDYIDCP